PAGSAIYVPFDQLPESHIQSFLSFLIRESGHVPENVVRNAISQAGANVPVTIGTMDSVIGALGGLDRFRSLLVAIFTGLALVLALGGIHGLLMHAVDQRTREIG